MTVNKTRNGGEWTPARFRSFIVSALRKCSSRWGPRTQCKKAARHREKLPNATGRLVFHSRCAHCMALIPETLSVVDHIFPVVDPAIGFTTFDEYIERMYCEQEGFQVLCQNCHSEKTEGERKIGTERKRRERENS